MISLVARHEITGTQVAIKIINKKKMKHSKMSQKVIFLVFLIIFFFYRSKEKLDY